MSHHHGLSPVSFVHPTLEGQHLWSLDRYPSLSQPWIDRKLVLALSLALALSLELVLERVLALELVMELTLGLVIE